MGAKICTNSLSRFMMLCVDCRLCLIGNVVVGGRGVGFGGGAGWVLGINLGNSGPYRMHSYP